MDFIELRLSNIDYALVGYFVECKEQGDREEIIQSILNDIHSIFTKDWYTSQSSMTTDLYNLLSKLQPVCYAGEVDKDVLISWLMKPEKIYYSSIFDIDERYRIAFSLRDIK